MTRATDPRGRLLDAALAVIDAEGLRGLTHRRLEAEAGLARGSARYHLGTNDQILAAALEHAALRDFGVIEAALTQLGLDALAGSQASYPRMVAAVVSALLETPGPIRARFELLLEATRRPSLSAEARRWRAQFVDTSELALRAVGVDEPHAAAVILGGIIDGLIFDAVITGRTTAPEFAELAATAILRPSAVTS